MLQQDKDQMLNPLTCFTNEHVSNFIKGPSLLKKKKSLGNTRHIDFGKTNILLQRLTAIPFRFLLAGKFVFSSLVMTFLLYTFLQTRPLHQFFQKESCVTKPQESSLQTAHSLGLSFLRRNTLEQEERVKGFG